MCFITASSTAFWRRNAEHGNDSTAPQPPENRRLSLRSFPISSPVEELMTNVIEIRSEANEPEGRTTLDALCQEEARQMLHRALEVEVVDYLGHHRDVRDEKGHAMVTRNGTARPRQVASGAGTMT